MPRLHLHIGDSKTGTTWIQSSLQLSRSALADRHRIAYPVRGQTETDSPSTITSGNGLGLLAGPDALAAGLDLVLSGDVAATVFSSEFMFVEILDSPDLGYVGELAERYGYDGIEVLLFIRDPIAQAASVWQQTVKRGGSTGPIDEILATFEAPFRVERVVDKLDAVRGVDVTIRNYSVTADRVLEEFAAWLGVPDDVLVRPPMVRVNRSLSAAELVLQRAVNAELGPSGRILSDALCEQLPDVEPVSPRPSDAAQHELWERVLPAVRRINERVEEPHRYRFDHMPPVEGADEYTMSAEQLELIGRMLGSALAAERAVTADDVTAEDVGTADGPAARSRVAERIASIESRMRALGRRR